MAFHNLTNAVVARQLLAPVVLTGTGAYVETTNRLDMRGGEFCTVIVSLGAIQASTTVDLKLVQSNASTSGTTKDLGTVAFTQIAAAGGNAKLYAAEIRTGLLDSANGFFWLSVQHKITNTNTCAAAIDAYLTGNRTLPASNGFTQQVTAFTAN